MTDWQVTAKTIFCESVNSEVTIIIKKDWSIQCTGYPVNTGKKSLKKEKLLCQWPDCRQVMQYKEFLMQEETDK